MYIYSVYTTIVYNIIILIYIQYIILTHTNTHSLSFLRLQKQNQLKLIHLPSNTVFNNWPTQKTPFGRIECMSFSGKNTTTNTNYGGFFAIGNSTGKVLLYQLNHFGSV